MRSSRYAIPLVAIFLTSCAAVPPPKYVACKDRDARCDVSDAVEASVETLRNRGEGLTVRCEREFDVALDDEFRASCRSRIDNLVATLSSKWSGQLVPIDASTITYKDATSYVTLYNGVCLELHSVEATIPLRWAPPR